MRIPVATTATLILSVSSMALVLTSVDAAKMKTGGVLGASHRRGANRHARRSLQPEEEDGMELIYPTKPRKHGKTTGDRNENGLVLGHGYMDDLDPRGAATIPTNKTPRSHKGTIESNGVVKQDANGDTPPNKTPKSKSGKGAAADTDTDVDADDTGVREEVVCVPRPGAIGPNGVRSDSTGDSNGNGGKGGKGGKGGNGGRLLKGTRRGVRRLSPKGTKVEIDSDCDGLTDKEEKKLGTNPHNWDSDEDGVSRYRTYLNLLWYEPKVLGQSDV